METDLEIEFKSLEQKYNQFMTFKNNHKNVKRWSTGYFSALTKELFMMILGYVDIKDMYLLNKAIHVHTMSDVNLRTHKKVGEIIDTFFHTHKFHTPITLRKFMSGMHYDEECREWYSTWWSYKRYKKTYKDRKIINGLVICKEDSKYGVNTVFKSNHGKKVATIANDPNISPFKTITKTYKIPSTDNLFVRNKWIKWVRNNKILPDDCSREEMLAIWPFIQNK